MLKHQLRHLRQSCQIYNYLFDQVVFEQMGPRTAVLIQIFVWVFHPYRKDFLDSWTTQYNV